MMNFCNAYDCKKYSHAHIDCSIEKNRNKNQNQNKTICRDYQEDDKDTDGLVIRSRCEFLNNKCCSIDDCEHVEDMKRGNYYDCDSYDAFI